MTRQAAGRRKLAGASALILLATGLVVAAVKYDGAPIHDVDLNDGGVWVTNASLGMMARLNTQVNELDLAVSTSRVSEAVFQAGASVQAFDSGEGAGDRDLHLVDPMTGKREKVSLGPDFRAAVSDGVAAVLDRKTGKVWIRSLEQLKALTESTPSDATVSDRGAVTVTHDGTALFLDRKKAEVRSWKLEATGGLVRAKTWGFDVDKFTDDAQLSAVGEKPVVAQAGKVLLPGEAPVEIPEADGDRPLLQEAGPEGDVVFAATDTGLWRVPLGGGEPEEVAGIDASGRPARPLVVDGCAHAAWADPDSDNYLRLCADEKPFTGQAASITAESRLAFRSNRGVVVLNDVASGNAWMVQLDGLDKISDWDSVNPNAPNPQKSTAQELKKEDRKNRRPEAKPDSFGARPESTVVLPVTLNDEDADGDILTVAAAPAPVQGVSFSVVGNGTQVQATVPKTAKGTITFEYQVTDGWLGNAPSTAQVELRVSPDGDRKPDLIDKQKNELTVAQGATATANVLGAWIDPDGDPVVLTGATSKDGEVDFRPDGSITFTDDGKGTGAAQVDFVVQGGKQTSKGRLAIKVVAADKAVPTVVADRFTGPVGALVLLEPLKNDTDPLGGELSLRRMDPKTAGGELDVDALRGTAGFTATEAGTYYMTYQAAGSNGRGAEPQLVRVDVTVPDDDNLAPVATRDLAVMRPGAPTLVDVLANDTDPDGDVLIVQGVEVPRAFQGMVKASLIDKRFVRVETLAPLGTVQPQLTYLLSDGRAETAAGAITLTPTEAAANRPPVAKDDDTVTARAGTIITVPVLANDEDPDGDKLTLSQADLTDAGGPLSAKVPVVAAGDALRVLVPDDGSTEFQVTYGVRDPAGLRDDARLVMQILPARVEGNRAPKPRPIVERTVVGQSVRVPVDLYGADPDGDPVVFDGVVEPPQLGRIGRTGSNWFEYQPNNDRERFGTDTFKVLVADGFGRAGVVQVRIGVAPRAPENQVPAALNDTVVVAPGLTIRYPVLENDTDPDGDPLSLVPEQLRKQAGVEARAVANALEVKVPSPKGGQDGVAVVQYGSTDGLGTDSIATLTVIGREDAPNHAPTTQDDVVKPGDLRGKSVGDTIDVDVLANDGDLDGSRKQLVLETIRPRLASVVDRKLEVKLGKKPRVVPYRVTDGTDASYGFVYVPGLGELAPTLDPDRVPLKVTAGKSRRISIDDLVVVRPGRSPRIARRDTVRARPGDAEKINAEGFTFTTGKDEYGPASVYLEVTDGEDLNDKTARLANITIPINIVPARAIAPEVRTASLTVFADDEDPRMVDLSRLATDANPDDELTFKVARGTDGLDVQQDGKRLSLSAGRGAKGGKQELEVTVTDSAGKTAKTALVVDVIPVAADGSRGGTGPGGLPMAQAPMTLRELADNNGAVGRASTFNLAQAVLSDPFKGKAKAIAGKPEVVSGQASVTSRGAQLSVTPRSKGAVVVSYRLSDGSGQPERAAVGKVTVVAADKPDAPGAPRAGMAGPSSVQVSWSAPADNGRPVDTYKVSWTGGGSQECRATTCTINKLDAATKYTFQVQAHNALGWGEKSAASNGVIPDVVPEQMAAPRIEPFFADRDRKLHLVWSHPRANGGSEPDALEFQASPRTGAGLVDKRLPPLQTRTTWVGLTNGTQYSFRVRAHNKRGSGPWSAWSAPAMPFTRPSTMGAPTLQTIGNGGTNGSGVLDVRWPAVSAPQNGYDPVLKYEVRLYRDEAPHRTLTVDATRNQVGFTVENGYTWKATVRALNRAGWSVESGRSAPQITYDVASQPIRVHVVDQCASIATCSASTNNYFSKIGLNTPADNGGYPVVFFRYRTSDNRSGTFKHAGATYAENVLTHANVTFNSPRYPWQSGLRVEVWGVTRLPDGTHVDGQHTVSAGVFNPWAKPKFPDYSHNAPRSVIFHCHGNGRPVWGRVVRGEGVTAPNFHTENVTNGSDPGCIRFRVYWDSVPSGTFKCATIYVVNGADARSVDSNRRCTSPH